MSTPFEQESWSNDFEFDADMREFDEAETEWESEFGRRRRARPPVRVVRPRPVRPRVFSAPFFKRPPQLRSWPRRPPPQPLFPVIVPHWGGRIAGGGPAVVQPPYAAPDYAEPAYAEPSYAEPSYAEPAYTAPPPSEPPLAEPSTVEPPADEPPAAQDPSPTEESYIEPEAFEFDSEFDEYEGGQPQPATRAACPPYQRGEVEKSRTQQGHLPSDVIGHARGLLIADFSVDGPSPKAALRKDAALRAWLNAAVQAARRDPGTKIRISGYSDCVGKENNNNVLRRSRAQRVQALLQQLAGPQWKGLRPRIVFVGAAPAGDYVADNGTIDGRARNRGVLIEKIIDFTPDEGSVITGQVPDTIERIIKRGEELIQNTDQFGIKISKHQQQRIRCILTLLSRPGTDDSFLTYQAVLDYSNGVVGKPYFSRAKQWLLPEHEIKSRHKVADDEIRHRLVNNIDWQIYHCRDQVKRMYDRTGVILPQVQQLNDWMAKQQNNSRSIYWCYRP